MSIPESAVRVRARPELYSSTPATQWSMTDSSGLGSQYRLTTIDNGTPPAAKPEANKQDSVPTWRKLMFDFSQDTTLHGVRYITMASCFVSRRVIWALISLTALALFIFINVENIIMYRRYPIGVSVEVNPRTQLIFPAVTLCNYNRHSLSGLSELGLYENVWEQYSESKTTSGACQDTFTYYENLCIDDITEYLDKSTVYEYVSEIVCEKLCTDIHNTKCSAIMYDRTVKQCIVTAAVLEEPDPGNNSCSDVKFEYYRRNRCKVPVNIFCSFESDEVETGPCPQLKTIHTGEKSESWVRGIATENYPYSDHTIGYGRGHFVFLTSTHLRPGYTATLETNFLYLNDSCLQLSYYFEGYDDHDIHIDIKLRGETLDEDLLTTIQHNLNYWPVHFQRLPEGFYQVVIQGIRSETPETAGIAMDDIYIAPCEEFSRNCKSSTHGDTYRGTIDHSATNKPCVAWADAPYIGSVLDEYFPYETADELSNHCRNPYLLDAPFCYLSDGDLEECDIPYCPCREDQYRCGDGTCISHIYLCDGIQDCSDASDETNEEECTSRSIACEFEDRYLCGYVIEGTSYLWKPLNGLGVTDGIGPNTDHEDSVLGKFMYADSRFGTLAQTTSMTSVMGTFEEGQCLSFYLFLKFTKDDDYRKFSVSLIKESMRYATPSVLYETVGPYTGASGEWRRYVIPLPVGRFAMRFLFSMGYPFEVAAGLDSVQLVPCAEQDDILQTLPISDTTPLSILDCKFTLNDECAFTQASLNGLDRWAWIWKEHLDIISLDGDVEGGQCYVDTLISTTGVLTSPSFPDKYPNYLNPASCYYHIKGWPGSSIIIKFLVFDVEEDEDCRYDYVEIQEGSHLSDAVYRLCSEAGTYYPVRLNTAQYQLTGPDVYVTLHTDYSVQKIGFKAAYEIESADAMDNGEEFAAMLTVQSASLGGPSWSALYTPMLKVAETSCLEFFAAFTSRASIRVDLLGPWNVTMVTSQVDYRLNTLGNNKLRLTIPVGTYQIAFTADYVYYRQNNKGIVHGVSVKTGTCLDIYTTGTWACDFSTLDQCGYMDASGGSRHWLRSESENALEMADNTGTTAPTVAMSPVATYASPVCVRFELGVAFIPTSSVWSLALALYPPGSGNITTLGKIGPIPNTGAYSYQFTVAAGTHRLMLVCYKNKDVVLRLNHILTVDGECHDDGSWSPIQPAQLTVESEVINNGYLTPLEDALVAADNDTSSGSHAALPPPPPSTRRRVAELLNVEEFFINSSHHMEDFIHSCTFNGVRCNYSQFETKLTDFGVCFTFNGDVNNILGMSEPGAQHGLSLTLNIEQYDHTIGANLDAGIKVHLHQQRDIPNVKNVGVAASLSADTLFEMTLVQAESLGPPYGVCDERELARFPGYDYTEARCALDCEAGDLEKTCGCMDYYMPVQFDDEFCTVQERFDCVENLNSLRETERDCTCPRECNLTSFASSTSVASLSSFGVSELLSMNEGRVERRYRRSLELRHRMEGDLYVQTVDAMVAVPSALSDFISYAEDLTSGAPTSVFKLMEQSVAKLNTFMGEDFDLAFRDIRQYSQGYDYSYKPNQDARLAFMNNVKDQVLFFMEATEYDNGDSLDINELQSDLGALTAAVRRAFSRYDLDKSRPVPSYEDFLLPQRIFPDRGSESLCNNLGYNGVDTDGFIANSDALMAVNDSDAFKNTFREFDYNEFINSITSYIADVTQCTSLFKNYVSDLNDFVNILTLFKSTQISTGANFIFEKESKDILDFAVWFEESVTESYFTNDASKLEISQKLTPEIIQDLIISLTTFRDEIWKHFDTPMSSFLTASAHDMAAHYITILQKFIEGEGYFGTQKDFRKIGSEMKIWRIPQAFLISEELIKFQYTDIERVWPESLSLETFMQKQAPALLVSVAVQFHQELQDELGRIDTRFAELHSRVTSSLNKLSVILSQFNEENDIDTDFILKNFLTIRVFYGELQYELIKQYKAYPLEKFFSDMGGFMGLLLGGSAISVIEIFDLLIYNMARKIQRKFSGKPSTP